MKFPDGFYWGETVRVRSDSMSLRKTFSEISDFEKVDSLCKRTVARPCQIFLEVTNRNIDKANTVWETVLEGSLLPCSGNLNRVCKTYSICKMQQRI